ncbi:putative aminoglycoside nucleotidyltransferase [[Actinomadura] parvosata subsp. kistnae]|uniref:Amino acid transporter n=1 Tax=[Actinomadura] parvosata subsp. kistnae TaxID=1909395 RepID=A0A1U9ZS81_9ACTN|nr:amino acid transporter [Nonomuraea sp. ATCC 55076]AQZ60789.1 amino acid transporter [Nonomuraea sp. ATCC 55076]SPL90578.1 putative aminoglycoside nucleotidyltransferase [Actinomadura parvosata subsp. kistnae]
MFEAGAVLGVLEALRKAGCAVWVAGGWGIDALVGRVTREHGDLDLLHRAEQEPAVIAALESLGYAERTEGVVPGRPARFVMTGPGGRELDLHPLHFRPDGSALQRLDDEGGAFTYPAEVFVTGEIEGVRVPCLSVAQQVSFHQGYPPRERDLLDMARLRAAYGIDTHF